MNQKMEVYRSDTGKDVPYVDHTDSGFVGVASLSHTSAGSVMTELVLVTPVVMIPQNLSTLPPALAEGAEDDDLLAEFSMWDAASDEALVDFEAIL